MGVINTIMKNRFIITLMSWNHEQNFQGDSSFWASHIHMFNPVHSTHTPVSFSHICVWKENHLKNAWYTIALCCLRKKKKARQNNSLEKVNALSGVKQFSQEISIIVNRKTLWTLFPSLFTSLLNFSPGNESYLAIQMTDDPINLWVSSVWSSIYSPGPTESN